MKNQLVAWCKKNYFFLIIFSLLAISANLFLFQFYSQEKFIYSWDWSAYQSKFEYMVNTLRHNPYTAVRSLIYSIAYTENSLLAPFLLALIGQLFGAGRSVFLFSILNIFAIPAALIVGAVSQRLTDPSHANKWKHQLVPFAITLLTPQFWIPILLGYYDVSGIIIIGLIWFLLLSQQPHKSMARAIIIGMLLATLIFVRRWFAYWSVSFFPAVLLQNFISYLKKESPLWLIKQLLACGLTAFLVFVVFAAPLGYQMLTTNYSHAFQAYKFGYSTWTVMRETLLHYGWFSLMFAAFGFILSLKNHSTKAFAQIIGWQTLFAVFLFARVQRPEYHHQYPFLVFIIIFQTSLVIFLLRTNIRLAWKLLFCCLFATVSIINFAQALIPQFQTPLQTAHLFTDVKHYPMYRNDTKEIERLLNFLEQTTPPDSKIYVVASSSMFNDDILRNSCLYLSLKSASICRRVLPASHVDARDGFPMQFFNADYVIITTPTQYHLRPEDQQVIRVLAEQLNNPQSIGAAYLKLPEEFTLDGQIKVGVLKKLRPVRAEERQNVKNAFINI